MAIKKIDQTERHLLDALFSEMRLSIKKTGRPIGDIYENVGMTRQEIQNQFTSSSIRVITLIRLCKEAGISLQELIQKIEKPKAIPLILKDPTATYENRRSEIIKEIEKLLNELKQH